MHDIFIFLKEKLDAREYKRALAVRLLLKGYLSVDIEPILGVSAAFIRKWHTRYHTTGVEGFRLGHHGSMSYLTGEERQQIPDWLHQQKVWDVVALSDHIAAHYDVVFKSKQSYYQLFADTQIHWKKVQPINPKKMTLRFLKKKRL